MDIVTIGERSLIMKRSNNRATIDRDRGRQQGTTLGCNDRTTAGAIQGNNMGDAIGEIQ
jgi:hypothetical protein